MAVFSNQRPLDKATGPLISPVAFAKEYSKKTGEPLIPQRVYGFIKSSGMPAYEDKNGKVRVVAAEAEEWMIKKESQLIHKERKKVAAHTGRFDKSGVVKTGDYIRYNKLKGIESVPGANVQVVQAVRKVTQHLVFMTRVTGEDVIWTHEFLEERIADGDIIVEKPASIIDLVAGEMTKRDESDPLVAIMNDIVKIMRNRDEILLRELEGLVELAETEEERKLIEDEFTLIEATRERMDTFKSTGS